MSRFGSEWPDPDDGVGAPDTAAARFSSSLSLAVCAAAVVVLGVAVGSPFGGPVAAVGAGVVGWSAAELDGRSHRSTGDAGENARRAVGSVGIIVGTSLLAAALGLFAAAPFVGVAATFAVVAASLDRFAGLTEDTVGDLSRAVIQSGAVVVGFGALALLAQFPVLGFAASTAAGLFSALGASALLSLFVVQLELLFVAFTVDAAVGRLERLHPDGRAFDRIRALDAVAVAPRDVPRGVWIVVAGTGYLAASPWGRAVFDGFLASLSVLGTAVSVLLRSGVVTGALGLVAGSVAAVFVADAGRSLVELWLGSDPPETLSAAAGGVVTGVVVSLAAAVPPFASAVAAALPDGTLLAAFVRAGGVGAALLGATAGMLVVVLGVLLGVAVLVGRGSVPPAAGGFALGSGLLFLAALLAAAADAAAVVTVAVVGAALVVWDLGENAVDVGATLGTDAETRRGEAVHAAGTLAAVAAAVALATGSLYVLGPLSVPADRARLALLLVLVAFLALAAATYRD